MGRRHGRAGAAAVAAALAATVAACGVSVEAPYLLNDLKVVAIEVEPPEVQAGQTARLRATVASPNLAGAPDSARFSYCAEHDWLGTALSCADPVALPSGAPVQVAPHVFQADTSITVDPSLVATVPGLLLQAGFWLNVYLRVDGAGVPPARALKRLVVSGGNPPPVPNRNPVLHAVDVWLAGRQLAEPLVAPPGAALTLLPDYAPHDFAPYEVLGTDGTFAPRLEAPQITWYVTAGSLDSALTRGNRPVLWTLPAGRAAPGATQQFVAVLRDGRGGTAAVAGSVAVGAAP